MSEGTDSASEQGLTEAETSAEAEPAAEVLPGRVSRRRPSEGGPRAYVLDDREKKLAIQIETRIEKRIQAVIRQESGDSYAGLPADHVLVNLDRAFPDVGFPARMMQRLEAEQAGRLEHEKRQDDLAEYEAQTRRTDSEADRKHLSRAANRALLALALLLGIGVMLTLLGHEAAGIAVLTTTVVGVIGAFLTQQQRGK